MCFPESHFPWLKWNLFQCQNIEVFPEREDLLWRSYLLSPMKIWIPKINTRPLKPIEESRVYSQVFPSVLPRALIPVEFHWKENTYTPFGKFHINTYAMISGHKGLRGWRWSSHHVPVARVMAESHRTISSHVDRSYWCILGKIYLLFQLKAPLPAQHRYLGLETSGYGTSNHRRKRDIIRSCCADCFLSLQIPFFRCFHFQRLRQCNGNPLMSVQIIMIIGTSCNCF